MAQNKFDGALDTNVLLRLLVGDVPAQTKSVEALLERSSKFFVSDVALTEFIFVLEKCYTLERSVVCMNVRTIFGSSKIKCNQKMFTQALEIYEAESKLSIVDCILLTEVRIGKIVPLYSYDKELIKKSEGDCVAP